MTEKMRRSVFDRHWPIFPAACMLVRRGTGSASLWIGVDGGASVSVARQRAPGPTRRGQIGSCLCVLRAGSARRLPAAPPTDPDVRTLTHPVPQPTDLPSAMVPEAIRSSYVDRHRNLDVLHLFPSIGSAGRRFASLPRVLRGEFPCFNGTIKALRLPAARPAALRCLRLAVPQRFTRSFCSPADECAAEAWSW
jgi:hypothetical protein